MSETTKIIPPPRRAGPRWIDLVLAAVAGALLTLVLVGLIVGGGFSRFAGATPSPSPSPSQSPSASPTATIQIRTAAPTTAAPSPTTAAPTTAAPTTAPPTAAPTTPAPTRTATPTPAPTRTP